MKQFLIPLLLGALPMVARAQVPPATPLPPDTARVFKHELGLVAQPLLTQSFFRAPIIPFGIIYRGSLGKASALRVVAAGFYSQRDSVDQGAAFAPRPYTLTAKVAGLWVGYERCNIIYKRIKMYYGLDAGLQWRKYQGRYHITEALNQGQATLLNTYGYQDNPVWSWQLRSFVGIKVQLSSHWTVAFESGAFGAYERRYYKSEEYNELNVAPDGGVPQRYKGGYGYWHSFNTIIGLRPVQSIGFSFHF